jgi:electron transport complex protein RnfE
MLTVFNRLSIPLFTDLSNQNQGLMNKVKDIALDGLIRQNPVLKLVLGICATLAVSTTVINGVGMGVVVTFVTVFSNILVSLLRNVIPSKVRMPAYILIITTFSTIVDMALAKVSLSLYDSLGVFIPLVAVNCIIFGRAESFASSNKVHHAALDGLFMGLGFTYALVLICIVREILGAGSILGYQLWNFTIDIFAGPAGAFLVFGFVLAAFNYAYKSVEKSRKIRVANKLKEERRDDERTLASGQ